MADIFIAYAHQEAEFAGRLANFIECNGWTTFWDTDIAPGDDWRSSISTELEAAQVVLVLWTPASKASRWVCSEAEAAAKLKKYLPVLVDGTLPPLGLDQVQGLLFAADDLASAESGSALLKALSRHCAPRAAYRAFGLASPSSHRYDVYLSYATDHGDAEVHQFIENLRRSGLRVYDWKSRINAELAKEVCSLSRECKTSIFFFDPHDGTAARTALTLEAGMFSATMGQDRTCIVYTEPHGGPVGAVGTHLIRAGLAEASEAAAAWIRSAT